MSLSLNDQYEVYRGSSRVIFPRDGEHSPAAVLAGFSDTDDIVFGRFTTDGRLRVDAEVTMGEVTIGDVKLLLDVNGVDKKWSGLLNPDATTYAAFVQDQRMSFTAQNELLTSSRVRNSSAALINPATEETLQALLAAAGGTVHKKYFPFIGTQSPEVEAEYDFGGVMQDVYLYVSKDVTVKWNSLSDVAFDLEAGEYDFPNQYASKIFLTNAVSMNVEIYANGGV